MPRWQRGVARLTRFLLGAIVLVAVVLGGEVAWAVLRGERVPDVVDGVDGLLGDPAAGPPLQVVWLGDSTAVGVGADDAAGTMARKVTGFYAAQGPVQLTVRAVSGAVVADVRDEQVPAMAAIGVPRADVVFVSVGANDVTHLTGTDTFASRYAETLDRLEPLVAEGGRIVVLGVPDMGAVPRFLPPLRQLAELRGHQLDDRLEQLAAERDHTYVDIEALTGPGFRDQPDVRFARDDFHPSSLGYDLWAEAVLAALGTP